MRVNLSGTGSASIADTHDGALFDLDGVVYRGAHAVPAAVEAIGRLHVPTGFVTNNASRSPLDVANHLNSLGVDAHAEQVMTSALAAAGLVRDLYGPGVRALKVGGDGLAQALLEAGVTLVKSATDQPQVVVQGTSQKLTWSDLAEAVYAINAGADHIATNLDSTMPTERGMALGNGALVQAVIHATGKHLRTSAGKPDPAIFLQAAKSLKINSPVVIGDRLDTDILGANRAGFAGAVVLTGVADARTIINAQEENRPAYILKNLHDLHKSHPMPELNSKGWVCGTSTAWAENGTLRVETRGEVSSIGDSPISVPLDALRALCAAAWNTPGLPEVNADIHIGH